MTEPAPPPDYPGSGQTPAYAPPGGASGPRANFGYRLLAVLLDTVIFFIPAGILIAVFAAIADEGGAVLGYLIAIVGNIVYFTYFEGSPSGQTPGKKIVNIRVIDYRTGGPIGYPRALGRFFARWLSQLPCYLGYFWMLWDREKQTWHDKLVNDVVVPTSAYPVERWPG